MSGRWGLFAGLFAGFALVVVMVRAPSATAGSGALSADDQLKWDAAQALYGAGLVVKKTKTGVSIKAAKGGLTQETFNKYVPIYLEELQTMSGRRQGTSFKWAKNYADAKFDPRAAKKLGMLLLEPAFKLRLCTQISSRIGDKPTTKDKWDRSAWCVEQGILDATTDTCVYRGADVACSSAGDDHAGLELDGEIFAKDASGNYPIVVTVSGGRDFINNSTTTIAGAMLDDLVSAATRAKTIEATWQSRLKKYHKLVKAAEKKQRKLAKNKLAFSNQPFAPWEVRKPEKKVSCKTPHVIVYAPSKETKHGYYEVVSIDKTVCIEMPLGAAESDTRNIYITEACRNLLDKSQDKPHEIEVGVYQMKIGASSTRKELKNGRVKDVRYDWGTAGKKLFSSTASCSM